MKIKELILNPYFITGLILLILNDFYLKYKYGNFITGKLSDFAGLLIFPMFFAALVPKLKKYASLITGIGFILWKLPLLTPAIGLINQILPVTIHRVIDYSDYMALLILPLSHYLINTCSNPRVPKWGKIRNMSKYALAVTAFCAFCSTSVLRPWTEMPQGTVFIGESYNIKLPKDSVINSIKQLGYDCNFRTWDTTIPDNDSTYQHLAGYYQTGNIIRYYSDSVVLDTLTNVKFQLIEINPNKTKLTIINVTLNKEGNIQDWKRLKSLSKIYNSWLKDNLIEKIKK
ncbi:hypothetical protein D0T84_18475 [Dysgonomonas sp. 521]|uniref:hypothetical protein n=1 Tax=Dysgonomonas sp. 521 TaxID=2302932 RepID=UPI0013D0A1C0|nr:hypothetical protein [Dysgonomonas sp. 521]NDV96876.1 hypothetical protein [Dysgonomonas sp. 521]